MRLVYYVISDYSDSSNTDQDQVYNWSSDEEQTLCCKMITVAQESPYHIVHKPDDHYQEVEGCHFSSALPDQWIPQETLAEFEEFHKDRPLCLTDPKHECRFYLRHTMKNQICDYCLYHITE